MLQSIHIQNFRCFEDFKAEGFERINLIGGKNNSGKSCLLEGILCLNTYVLTSGDKKNDDVNNFRNGIWNLRNEKPRNLINQNQGGNFFSISYHIESITNRVFGIGKQEKKVLITDHWLTVDNTQSEEVNYVSRIKSCPLIDFDKLIYRIEKEDRLNEFVNIFQKVDNSITKLRTIGGDGPTPQIKQNYNSKYIFISSLGYAINSLLRYFAPIVERLVFGGRRKETFILLIDEIENGIHYTAHKEFWQHLFKLCKELNVQVFATTHSLEMIKAFNEVALQEGEASYFEMARDVTTNEIFIDKHEPEQLNYELLNPHSTFRGE